MEDKNISMIVNECIGIVKKCAIFCVKDEEISSIFLKQQFKLIKLILQVNDLLKDKSKESYFYFVCNDIVTRAYLWKDGIHLKNEGTRIFAGNLVDYLNDFVLSKNG